MTNEVCSLCGVILEELDVKAFAANEESLMLEGICPACWVATLEKL